MSQPTSPISDRCPSHEEEILPYNQATEEVDQGMLRFKIESYAKCMSLSYRVTPSPANGPHEVSIWTNKEMEEMKGELRLMMKDLSGYGLKPNINH